VRSFQIGHLAAYAIKNPRSQKPMIERVPALPNVQFYAFANTTSAAAQELIAAVEKSGRQGKFHMPARW
jgi:hypothetical protein